MSDHYTPKPARIDKIKIETSDKSLKTYDLSFVDPLNFADFKHLPGQFIHLSIPEIGEFPVGIASSPSESNMIKVSIKNAGTVTSNFHRLKVGDNVGVRGPYGNPFPWNQMQDKNVLMIGGGFAFTTLRAAILFILDQENRKHYGKLDVIYGARNPDAHLYRHELNQWISKCKNEISLHLTVDDKSGRKWEHHLGLIPDVVRQCAPKGTDQTITLVCGPPNMVKYTLLALKELDYDPGNVYVSLENRMKCGIGLCGHCNIGDQYVCTDGPVFSQKMLEQMPNEL